MTSATHPEQSSAPALYLAVELSTKEWLLTMATGPAGRRQRARMSAGDRAAYERVVAAAKQHLGLAADAVVRSCYEAGRDGFWPHRFLTAAGVVNLVVDSSSIEVPRRARRAKTDRLDGEKLLRLLLRHWSGERQMWQVVHVPSREAEDARQASRGLTTLQADRTRYRNRLRGLLALHGVRRVRIDGHLPARVATLRDWAGAALPPGVVARLVTTARLLQAVDAERRQAQRAEREQVRTTASRAQRLVQLRGVAARSATILNDELFARGLRHRREVGALSGLVSMPHRSGTIHHDQGLTRSGLPAVRRIAIELAWAWLRYQPRSALTQWYHRRFGGGSGATRRIGIVALARRVIIALWRYGDTGVVPAGAELKA